MYLTYDEYEKMGGNTLDETTFAEYEFEAEMQINYYTFDRLVNEEELPEVVKRCVYALINIILSKRTAEQLPTLVNNNLDSASIASQSNDGVSISYNTMSAKEAVELSEKSISTTINRYLQGVKNSLGRRVLYRGIYPNE